MTTHEPDDWSLPVPVTAPAQRIGDAERDRAVTALSEHFALGRLDHVELDHRVEAAYRATTVDQLVALFVDLPDPAPFRPNRRQRRATARASRGASPWMSIPVVPVLALVVAITVLVVSRGGAFFVLPMLWFWLGAGRGWYRHHPPYRR